MTLSITSVRVVSRSLKRTFLKGSMRLVALAAFCTLLASFTGSVLVERMERRAVEDRLSFGTMADTCAWDVLALAFRPRLIWKGSTKAGLRAVVSAPRRKRQCRSLARLRSIHSLPSVTMIMELQERNTVTRCRRHQGTKLLCRPSHPQYQTYGARGITVCDRWRASFETFLSNEGSRLAPNLKLDHIDNNRGYEPSNIRSTTKSVQQKNRRPSSEWRRLA